MVIVVNLLMIEEEPAGIPENILHREVEGVTMAQEEVDTEDQLLVVTVALIQKNIVVKQKEIMITLYS